MSRSPNQPTNQPASPWSVVTITGCVQLQNASETPSYQHCDASYLQVHLVGWMVGLDFDSWVRPLSRDSILAHSIRYSN